MLFPIGLGGGMTFTRTAIVAAAAWLVGAPMASAQHRGGHGGGGGHATARAGSGQSGSRSASPRSSGAAPRAGGTSERAAGARHAPGSVTGTAVPRAYGAVVRPYGYVGAGVFRGPIAFYRPYYAFRPRFSIGFGFWAGFPIAYPYYWGYYDPFYAPYYAYPYPYPYPYAYPAPGYPPPSSTYPPSSYPSQPGRVQVQPPNQDMGGVSFEITPPTAEVWVDGERAGTVNLFTPRSQPLGLTQGRHHIEIRAPGYQTMEFDADIVGGQVIPYQGTLER
jgi:hypothetical protein